MMMGENIDAGESNNLDWVVYFAYTCLINIVALNLLISIISNTFDNVLSSFDATWCTTRAGMLLELGQLHGNGHDDSKNLKTLFIINYANEAIGAEGGGDEFTGKIRMITNKISSLNSKFEALSVLVKNDNAEIK